MAEKKSDTSTREEEVLAFWREHKIFEKSVERPAPKGDYVFYDGPPFATGLPHYGHIVASVIKDVVPRYFTMRGFRVPRRWGWDCHGLPIENIVEKEIGSTHKKDIVERVGIAKFNELCRSKVMTYADEWKRIVPRIGRWADMDNPYFTMSRDFMESVWWVFKQLWDKGLVYEDYRSMHICPRCETTLSQGEVAEGYKDIKDLSVVAKFELVDEPGTYLLAWTTTPWTLPGNVALAVRPDGEYERLKSLESGETYVAMKERVSALVSEKVALEGVRSMRGSELVGKRYKPLFDSYATDQDLKNRENGWCVYAADFVTTDSGTGIVHIAPAFGADDMALGKKENLPFVQHVGMDGVIRPEVKVLAGLSVKPIGDVQATDVAVIKYLAGEGLLFSKEKYEHSYPHCWRCDTPLINYATSSWFVKVEELKPTLTKTAEHINWSPAHIKEGRFGKWLEGARDWSISRQRFWASVIPLWKCDVCGIQEVFGSASDLEAKVGKTVDDLHKHVVDELVYPCACKNGTMRRVPDVLDTWFDSGSMPYGQAHYPFEGREAFEKTYPAQFIAEGQDQCRAWFYYLHVLAGGVFGKNAFQNVVVNGIVLAEDGKKMSKKLQNYPDPMLVVEKYGADALRLYLMASPVVAAENLNFSEDGVDEVARKVIDRLVNTYALYELYAHRFPHSGVQSDHILDRWIRARIEVLRTEVTDGMDMYQLHRGARALSMFVDELSTWYVRRSRDRLKSEEEEEAAPALATLRYALKTYSLLVAPFAPFIAEWLWSRVKSDADPESVHLAAWPEPLPEGGANTQATPRELSFMMDEVRRLVSLGLQARTSAGIKVRQPLARVVLPAASQEAFANHERDELLAILKDELNVKEVVWAEGVDVVLDTALTPELVREGQVRELLRAVQDLRKKNGLTPDQKVELLVSAAEDARALFNEASADLTRVANVKGVLFGEVVEGELSGELLGEGEVVARFSLRR